MNGYVDNIEQQTLQNTNFRKVLFTGKYLQLVVMSLKANEDIGMEVHNTVDQFFRVDKGSGKVIIDGKEKQISDGMAIVVPAGSQHTVIAGPEGLQLYTIYAPPNHPPGTIHTTKAEAMAAEEHHH